MVDRPPYTSLDRGQACLPCRRRKTKCDGARPVCSQCARAQRTNACEYADSQQHVQTEVLEENLALLRSRLEQLKDPNKATDMVLLHDPYAAYKKANPTSVPSPAIDIQAQADDREPHPSELVNTFLQNQNVLNFALHPDRTLRRLSLPRSDPGYPHLALIAMIRLWGLRLSQEEAHHRFEEVYRNRCVEALEDAMTATVALSGSRRLDVIQAEVLFAQYCFTMGRILEGRYHSNHAVTLSISCGLHEIGRSGLGVARGNLSRSLSLVRALDAPRGWIEFGERVRLFWSACVVDCCWNAALGQPLALAGNTVMNVPWPLDFKVYEDPHFSEHDVLFPGGNVFRNFLQDSDATNRPHDLAAIRLKSAALYAHACYLATQWYTDTNTQSRARILEEIRTLGRRIRQFGQSLPPAQRLSVEHEESLAVLTAHAFGHSAMISVHTVVASASPSLEREAINAALTHVSEFVAVVEKVAEATARFRVADPILSVLGGIAGSLVLTEIQRSFPLTTHEALSRHSALKALFKQLLSALLRAAGPMNLSPVFLMQADVLGDSESDM